MELDVVCGQWPTQKCIDWSRAIGKMSGSTETVLEKCPLEAALVASLKRIIYVLDFCALSVGVITKVSPRTLWFFLNSALSYMSGRHNIWCKSLNGVVFALALFWVCWEVHFTTPGFTIKQQKTDTLYKTHSEYKWTLCEHNLDSWWCCKCICAVIFHQSISINPI